MMNKDEIREEIKEQVKKQIPQARTEAKNLAHKVSLMSEKVSSIEEQAKK